MLTNFKKCQFTQKPHTRDRSCCFPLQCKSYKGVVLEHSDDTVFHPPPPPPLLAQPPDPPAQVCPGAEANIRDPPQPILTLVPQ